MHVAQGGAGRRRVSGAASTWLGAGPSPREPSIPVKPLLGITLKVLSALAFTVMSAGIKHVSADYPTGEIVFFRSAFAIVPLIAWLAWRGDLANSVRTSNVGGHLLRGIISSCGMFAG